MGLLLLILGIFLIVLGVLTFIGRGPVAYLIHRDRQDR